MKMIAVRIDDVYEDMNWINFEKALSILNIYGIKPLLGVIPKCEDEKLFHGEKRNDFFAYIRNLENGGCVIAQHGITHAMKNNVKGLIKIHKRGELTGNSFEEQKELLSLGKSILVNNGISTEIYMAPAHSFDDNTLSALKECGFKFISDGLTNFNYMYKELIFIPNLYAFRVAKKGISTLCLHTNHMSDENFKRLSNVLDKNKEYLVDYSVIMKQSFRKRFRLTQFINLTIRRLNNIIR